jgi:DNA-binding NarL/FixJ family response regulator
MTSANAPAPPAVRKSFILIVDDHPLVRHGLASLIGPQADLAVCGEAATPAEALAAVERLRPDLAIVDLTLGDADGLDLVKTIAARHRNVSVLVCSMHKESAYAERALRAGARGYVMKQEPDEVLLGAVRRVLSGQVHVGEHVASKMLLKLVNPAAAGAEPTVERLSDREFEVFRLIGRGTGPTDIARQLGVSVKTIETHRESIKRKLNLPTAHDLLRAAMRHADDGANAV